MSNLRLILLLGGIDTLALQGKPITLESRREEPPPTIKEPVEEEFVPHWKQPFQPWNKKRRKKF